MNKVVFIFFLFSLVLGSCTTVSEIESVKEEGFSEQIKELLIVINTDKQTLVSKREGDKTKNLVLDNCVAGLFKEELNNNGIKSEVLLQPELSLNSEEEILKAMTELNYKYILFIKTVISDEITTSGYGSTTSVSKTPIMTIEGEIKDLTRNRLIWKSVSHKIAGMYFLNKRLIGYSKLELIVSELSKKIVKDFNE